MIQPPDHVQLAGLIDCGAIAVLLEPVHASAMGEAAWPPLVMFKALLLSVWYDVSDVKLAEASDDRALCRRFAVGWFEDFNTAGRTERSP
jgi:hypothetical protein